MNRTYVIIVAAGTGSRFGSDIPKQFLPLGDDNSPVLMHTVRAFLLAGVRSDNIRLVLSETMFHFWRQLCLKHNFVSPPVVAGGTTRFQSVSNALDSISAHSADVVLVHDGARPLVTPSLISGVIDNIVNRGNPAAIPVINVADSLREIVNPGKTVAVDRSRYVAVQTPQGFRADILKAAYRTPYRDTFTDDASVVEAAGTQISTVPGDTDNIKITTPRDLVIAQAILSSRK